MASQVPCDHDHLGFCGPGEPVAGRWPFGEFRVKLSRLDVQPGLLPQLYRCYVIYGMNYWASGRGASAKWSSARLGTVGYHRVPSLTAKTAQNIVGKT